MPNFWNWDIILTTPNIGYIRDDIRLTAEKAYLHSNLAVIGIKGRYKESQHAATDGHAGGVQRLRCGQTDGVPARSREHAVRGVVGDREGRL